MHVLRRSFTQSSPTSLCCGANISYVPRHRGTRSHFLIKRYVCGVSTTTAVFVPHSQAMRLYEHAIRSITLGVKSCDCDPVVDVPASAGVA